MVIVKRLIGQGVTDSQGKVSVGYDSKGAGDLNIKCECMNLQETCEVLDSLFYDECTSLTDISSKYNITSTNTNVSIDESGTGIVVERTTTASSYVDVKINNSTSWRNTNTNYCIELNYICIRGGASSGSFLLFGGASIGDYKLGQTTDWVSLKFITDGNTLMPYYNGTHISAQDKTMSSTDGFRMQIYQNAKIIFKDLKIYPI